MNGNTIIASLLSTIIYMTILAQVYSVEVYHADLSGACRNSAYVTLLFTPVLQMSETSWVHSIIFKVNDPNSFKNNRT